ncbi:ATP-binding protein [Brevibacillus daliensis]|uniref:ATP-binding protein n=1 Tax=Brevibacillus daliensis TaxID=2892995 RepID=UPI001E63454A|nr:ATP-binding protein [Brevibacillus daliensis]
MINRIIQYIMIKRKVLLVTCLLILILTSIRILWISFLSPSDQPYAVQGVLDLQNWDIATERAISLNGDWEFYPNALLKESDAGTIPFINKSEIVQVPGNWKNYISPRQDSAFGYGSYRLRILVTPGHEQSYGIRVTNIPSSSELFVNGRLLAHSGYPAPYGDQYRAQDIPYSASFTTDQNEIEIVIHVANHDNHSKGGIVTPIWFGTDQAVSRATQFSIGMQLVVCLILFMHAIYTCILYFIGVRQKALIYFSLLTMTAIAAILIDDDRILMTLLPISYEWQIKLFYLSYLGVAVFLIQYIKHQMPEYPTVRATRWYSAVCAIYSIFILLTPVTHIMFVDYLHSLIVLIPYLVIPVFMLRMTLNGDHDAIYLFLGAISITLNLIWGIIKNTGMIEMYYYPVDMIVTFVAFASFWFKRYFRTSAQTAMLADKLQKADKLKDDFLVNTSHELRNPLHGILTIAQTVLDSGGSVRDDKNKENMNLLISVGKRMSFMLNDLLDLNRLKENRIRLQVTSLRLQTVASGVFDMIRFMTEGKPIQLINNIPDTFPNVIADENRLIQILFNLLHNAVKFTNEGNITIQAQVKEGKAVILILDTGIGMDIETQQRIFQPYEQGSFGITANVSGFGLGLSICKQLVELHGGTLAVSSTPGQGSVFTFTLQLSDPAILPDETTRLAPVSIAHSETAAAIFSAISEPKSEFATERPSILAIDDDPVNLNVLVNVLSLECYDIITATSGKEALSILGSREWDLIISDVMMPQMSGYELSRTIRERFSISELPILLLTARNRPEDINAGFLSGANDYVTKPVDTMELKSRVRALTELKKSVGERLRLEAAWLQAQIQPHFLFNTLNSIAALSDFDHARMRTLLEVFGSYLRSSFDFKNSERLVPLKHELDLVRSYLFIEKERFEERLQIVWEVDESIQLQIPPLSIQPLVENAIRHGVLKRSRGGKIHIRITDYADYAEVAIIDDGVGMDEKTLQRVLESRSDNRSGIGLINTDRRLKQIFGKGLQIQSSPDVGTTITFIVKK